MGIKEPKFKGCCKDLMCHTIYNITNAKQGVDLYTKTTREVAKYVGHTYSQGADMHLAIKTLELPTFVEPTLIIWGGGGGRGGTK